MESEELEIDNDIKEFLYGLFIGIFISLIYAFIITVKGLIGLLL